MTGYTFTYTNITLTQWEQINQQSLDTSHLFELISVLHYYSSHQQKYGITCLAPHLAFMYMYMYNIHEPLIVVDTAVHGSTTLSGIHQHAVCTLYMYMYVNVYMYMYKMCTRTNIVSMHM